jgi:hypothetical protein
MIEQTPDEIAAIEKWFDEHPGKLTWKGEDNFYRTGIRNLMNSRVAGRSDGNSSARVTLKDFENLIRKVPGSEENGSQFGEPFDQGKLQPPLTPGSLRAATSPQAETMVAEVLKALAE